MSGHLVESVATDLVLKPLSNQMMFEVGNHVLLEMGTIPMIPGVGLTQQNQSWVTNLTNQTRNIELTPKPTGKISVLSAAEFEPATKDLAVMDSLERRLMDEHLLLPPYAVARLRLATE